MTERLRPFGLAAGAVLTLLAALAAAPAANAASSAWQTSAEAKVRLISASETVGSDRTVRLGLHFKLTDGWKTYWRTPGDAGYPAKIDWSGSSNLRSASILWPVPHRFQLFGLETFGYADEVVLPIEAVVADPSAPARLQAKVKFLVCEKTCIPHTAKLSMTLPAGGGEASQQAHLINRYRTRVPGEGASAGLDLASVRLTETGETPRLRVIAEANPPFETPDVIVEGLKQTQFAKPDVTLKDDGRRAVLRLRGELGPTAEGDLAGREIRLTVFDGARGLERTVTLNPGAGDTGSLAGWTGPGDLPLIDSDLTLAGAAGALGLALLGGLILNLMPCVLPVLSLKLLSVVELGGHQRRHVRRAFLATAGGIVFSFLVLAAGAAALKALGVAVGWGIQFQQPLFLVAMTVVLTAFSANLFGLFEVPLPARLANALGQPAASTGAAETGLTGHFATGAFATLLATPCSAPFLGTAVGFALSRGLVEIAAIFTALGLGLALPYLTVAAVPGVATRLPRPGRWMVAVRRIMGLALAGTGVWLLTVLAAETTATTALVIGGLMQDRPAGLALRRMSAGPGRHAGPVLGVAAIAGAFVTPAALPGPATPPSGSQQTTAEPSAWRPLDRDAIDRLVANGKVVFVDVTAEWCITCKVNKQVVIESAPVQTRLNRADVVRMRGDWTRPSDRITDYLTDHGRYGVPFNAVYGPGAPDGIVLPELLSKSGVTSAIAEAGGTDGQGPATADRDGDGADLASTD